MRACLFFMTCSDTAKYFMNIKRPRLFIHGPKETREVFKVIVAQGVATVRIGEGRCGEMREEQVRRE